MPDKYSEARKPLKSFHGSLNSMSTQTKPVAQSLVECAGILQKVHIDIDTGGLGTMYAIELPGQPTQLTAAIHSHHHQYLPPGCNNVLLCGFGRNCILAEDDEAPEGANDLKWRYYPRRSQL